LNTKKNLVSKEDTLSVREQCLLLSLCRQGLYYQAQPEYSDLEVRILNRMDEIYTEIPSYGYRRQHQQLESEGFNISPETVRKYMRVLDLKTIYPQKKTTIPNKYHKVYPYLLKDLTISYPNQVWACDITYIRLQGGFCYLVAIIDWYSRYIISWKISNCLDTEFCLEVLKEALKKYPKPVIFNTDQGSQFTSHDFTKILKNNDIKISMDSVGRWADNVIIERWFRTLKYEDVYIKEYGSIKELMNGCIWYIDFYNQKRFHSSLSYQTPSMVYFSEN